VTAWDLPSKKQVISIKGAVCFFFISGRVLDSAPGRIEKSGNGLPLNEFNKALFCI